MIFAPFYLVPNKKSQDNRNRYFQSNMKRNFVSLRKQTTVNLPLEVYN